MNPMRISFENFLRRSLSFWVRKHPGSGWAGVSWGWLLEEAGDVWPSRGLSSLSSLLDRVTPRAQSEYNTPSAHYMLIPDPCSASSRALSVISLVTFIARGPLIGWWVSPRASDWPVPGLTWSELESLGHRVSLLLSAQYFLTIITSSIETFLRAPGHVPLNSSSSLCWLHHWVSPNRFTTKSNV